MLPAALLRELCVCRKNRGCRRENGGAGLLNPDSAQKAGLFLLFQLFIVV
jgi:hypothetical protein